MVGGIYRDAATAEKVITNDDWGIIPNASEMSDSTAISEDQVPSVANKYFSSQPHVLPMLDLHELEVEFSEEMRRAMFKNLEFPTG